MKFGIRTPNLSKRIKSRTTGKIKRMANKTVNPLYGKKGMGYVNNPKKAIYNKVYNKTSVSTDNLLKKTNNGLIALIILPFYLVYLAYKYLILFIIWLIKKVINLFKSNKEE